jgi:hypothetical protein
VQEHNDQGSANVDCPVIAGNKKPSVPQISYAAKNHTAENPNKICGQQRGTKKKNSCSRGNTEVTTETPTTKTAAPTPVSLEKRIIKGGEVAKIRTKGVVLPTATSSLPHKHNKRKNTSLNEDVTTETPSKKRRPNSSVFGKA